MSVRFSLSCSGLESPPWTGRGQSVVLSRDVVISSSSLVIRSYSRGTCTGKKNKFCGLHLQQLSRTKMWMFFPVFFVLPILRTIRTHCFILSFLFLCLVLLCQSCQFCLLDFQPPTLILNVFDSISWYILLPLAYPLKMSHIYSQHCSFSGNANVHKAWGCNDIWASCSIWCHRLCCLKHSGNNVSVNVSLRQPAGFTVGFSSRAAPQKKVATLWWVCTHLFTPMKISRISLFLTFQITHQEEQMSPMSSKSNVYIL